MNITLCLDNVTADQAEPLSPHKNMMNIHNPRKLSGIAAIPKPVVSTIANWMHSPRDKEPSEQQRDFLNKLAV